MAKIKTQINCPQCRQPIMADIQQVFDAGANPADKQILLSGQYNLAQCPSCGFYGNMSTPLVYHDPEKEMLMTFVPGELGLPMPEQEKVIGKLIQQVMESLPAEQRKAYLLSPQAVLTLEGLVERILEGEGISKEMIDKQKNQVSLIQRLASITSEEALAHVAAEEDENIDEQFFMLMNRLIQESMARGDQNFAAQLSELQQKLLPITTLGRQLQEKSQEMEEAVNDLQALGDQLTREKLLDLVINAPNEERLEAYVSIARQGMDYEWFQLLSDKIDEAEGEEKERLTGIREIVLEITEEIDAEVQQRMEVAKQNLEAVLEQENIPAVVQANLQAIDEFFMQMVSQEYEKVREEEGSERAVKLKQVIDTIVAASQAAQRSGEDVELMQALLEAEDKEARAKIMEENADRVTSEFVEALTKLLMQLDSDEAQKEMAEAVREIYREAVRFSMKSSMGKEE